MYLSFCMCTLCASALGADYPLIRGLVSTLIHLNNDSSVTSENCEMRSNKI